MKYYNLAKLLQNDEWILFFETLLFQQKDANTIFKQLNKQTKDYNLKKITHFNFFSLFQSNVLLIPLL